MAYKRKPVAKKAIRKPRQKAVAKKAIRKPYRKRVYKGRKVFKDDNANALVANKVTTGRKQNHNMRQLWKIVSANTNRNVYAVQWINRMGVPDVAGRPPGRLFLGTSWTGAAVGQGFGSLPLMLMSLTACPNINGTTVSNIAPLNILVRNTASGPMTWNNLGSAYTPFDVASNATQAGAYPGQSDVLKSVAIKFVLHGCLTRATKFRIDLVQLTEPYLHPEYINRGGVQDTTSLPVNESASFINFYSELAREYTFSSAEFSNGNATKGKIKYLKSWTHYFQPKLTNEPASLVDDPSSSSQNMPHSHIFNVFHRFNRNARYDWQETVTGNEPVTWNDGAPPPNSFNQTDVQPRARIYLMMRALAPVHNVNGGFKPAITPSFDMSVRTYHEQFG